MKNIFKVFLVFLVFVFSFFFNFCEAKENINIAYTLDNNFVLYTMISMNSILVNNKSDNDYTFYVVETDLTAKNKQKMENLVKKFGQKIVFYHFDLSQCPDFQKVYNRGWVKHITPVAMTRIYLPELLPADVHKILYLDGDTLVTDDIAELYNTNIDNYSSAMVKDAFMEEIARQDKLLVYYNVAKYYNSGVILFNLDKCRKNNLTQSILGYFKANESDFSKKFAFPVQDLLNLQMNNDVVELSSNWNN